MAHAQRSRKAEPAAPRAPRDGSAAEQDAPPRPEGSGSAVRKLTGIALLWIALAALVGVPSAGGIASAALAGLGFLTFAAGLWLFTDALKREVIAHLRPDAQR